jgi:hypothetical protein
VAPATPQPSRGEARSGWGTRGGVAQSVAVDLRVEEVEEVTPDLAWMTPVSAGVRVTLMAG